MGGHFQFVYIANMHGNDAVKKGVTSKFQLPVRCLALEIEHSPFLPINTSLVLATYCALLSIAQMVLT